MAGPSYRTELLSIYTYRVAFRDFEFGKGAAVGVVIMLINLAFALVYLRIARKRHRRWRQRHDAPASYLIRARLLRRWPR